jgi:hypothetical protein
MVKEPETSGEPEVQVMVVPDDAMKSVEEFLKSRHIESSGVVKSGTGCRVTTHSDLHCGDIDNVIE